MPGTKARRPESDHPALAGIRTSSSHTTDLRLTPSGNEEFEFETTVIRSLLHKHPPDERLHMTNIRWVPTLC